MSTALVAASIGWISCPPAHRSEPDGFTIILISCWSRRSGQRPISFKRRRRGKEASDRKDLGDRAGLRRDPCGSAGSDRHHATPLQDEEAVLELLRPGYGDPLELGLHSVGPWIRCLDQDRCTENAWALSSAQPFLEEHLLLKSIFKGAATTVITQRKKDPIYARTERPLDSGTKPMLAKLSLARFVISQVLGSLLACVAR